MGENVKRQALIDYRDNRTQEEMGKKYGVTQQAWAQWENGKTAPNVATMKQIENDSGVPMDVLFFDLFNKKNLLSEQKENESNSDKLPA